MAMSELAVGPLLAMIMTLIEFGGNGTRALIHRGPWLPVQQIKLSASRGAKL